MEIELIDFLNSEFNDAVISDVLDNTLGIEDSISDLIVLIFPIDEVSTLISTDDMVLSTVF